MTDAAFWETVAPLRAQQIADAWFVIDAWIEEPRDAIAEEMFVAVVMALIRLTADDRAMLLSSAPEVWPGADPGRITRLQRLADRLRVSATA